MKDPYNIKENIKEYFHFSKSEQRGILILLVLTGFFLLLPKVYKLWFYEERIVDFSEFEKEIQAFEESKTHFRDSIEAIKSDRLKSDPAFPERKEKIKGQEAKLFHFDPNTVTLKELMRLGVRERTAKTLIRYREKGGQFRRPDDLKKIYGLSDADFHRLLPYISILRENSYVEKPVKEPREPAFVPSTGPDDSEEEKDEVIEEKKIKKDFPEFEIEINRASAEDWQKLYGIGPAFSNRIVKFREALGGFHSVEQISEVYGLPDSTFQAIKPFLKLDGGPGAKININRADLSALKKHPYITWKQANAIVNYRAMHGAFGSIEDIGQIGAIDEKTYLRLAPYLTVGELKNEKK